MRTRSILTIAASGMALLALTGGCDKLTRNNFDMITINVDAKPDVERMIGPPSDKMDDMWHYERVDKHLNVMVHFNDDELVTRKEWHDVENSEHFDSMPEGERPPYESTRIRKTEN